MLEQARSSDSLLSGTGKISVLVPTSELFFCPTTKSVAYSLSFSLYSLFSIEARPS